MHYKTREAVEKAKKTGVITFSTIDNRTITTDVSEIKTLEYVSNNQNCHRAVVGNSEYLIDYGQLKKLRVIKQHCSEISIPIPNPTLATKKILHANHIEESPIKKFLNKLKKKDK